MFDGQTFQRANGAALNDIGFDVMVLLLDPAKSKTSADFPASKVLIKLGPTDLHLHFAKILAF